MGFGVGEILIGGFVNSYDLTLPLASIASAVVGAIVVFWARGNYSREDHGSETDSEKPRKQRLMGQGKRGIAQSPSRLVFGAGDPKSASARLALRC